MVDSDEDLNSIENDIINEICDILDTNELYSLADINKIQVIATRQNWDINDWEEIEDGYYEPASMEVGSYYVYITFNF